MGISSPFVSLQPAKVLVPLSPLGTPGVQPVFPMSDAASFARVKDVGLQHACKPCYMLNCTEASDTVGVVSGGVQASKTVLLRVS